MLPHQISALAASLMVGLESALGSSWLCREVFAKPPQAVMKEALAVLAEESLEDCIDGQAGTPSSVPPPCPVQHEDPPKFKQTIV